MAETSVTTGEIYYSGSWEAIRDIIRWLKMGEGKLAKITMELVNSYQEMVDREIDGMLGELYHVPLKAFNQVQPDGSTQSVFPGAVRRLARYWTAGLLIHGEYQQLEPNMSEAATSYIEDSRRELFRMIRFNMRIPGQERKSHISRTMPPTMHPATMPEPDF